MNIEEFVKKFSLNSDQGKALTDFLGRNFINKEKFNEVNEAKKNLETTIGERDKQLAKLKKDNEGNEGLQKTIDTLQAQNKSQKDEYAKNIMNLKVDNALNAALTGAKAKNNAAVKAILGLKDMELDANGKIKGLDEAIAKVKEGNPWAFETEAKAAPHNNIAGYKPAESGDPAPNNAGNITLEQQIANGIAGKF